MIDLIITGAAGQLGKACIKLLPFRKGYSLYTFDRGQLDIGDREKINGVLHTLPEVRYWINCAAYTKVDQAEKEEVQAFLYNAIAPGYIAEACKKAGVHLIHFSSDYVYHNALRRPLREDDPTEPKGAYARTKLAGEEAIIASGASHTILRTSWVYGPGGHNFVNTMLRLGSTHTHLKVVADQLGAPTFTYDIVEAIKDLLALHASGAGDRIQGVFNFANAGEVTWADFARTIFCQTGSSCQVEDITTEAYGAPAHRPAYSVLDCSRISALLSSPIPDWEDALRRYLELHRAGNL